MGNSLNLDDREFIWTKLADFFTSAEVESFADFTRLAEFPLSDLREIFFREVAIVCGHNLWVTTPVLGEGFDPEWVKREAAKVMSWRERGRGPLGKAGYLATRLLYRWLCGGVWREVEAALARIPGGPAPCVT
ncbi:hypothetical protein [Thiomonas sp.]|jgi:hypothetical protein|uniref:DUF7079 family protein n=1 Tax=Thiomonas sp. TaxID=2047785 RepID=UPI002614CF41|nr:hypothetical protein [Thiomonas sp.]